MFQRHRTATSRIARMLRELQGADTEQDRPADVGKPATDRGGHRRRRTAQQWYRAAAVLIAAGFVAVIAWQARVAEMTEAAVTPARATTDRVD
jgi:ferric-dicitrate binding protein FerR (iron transport regulator)